MAGHLFASDRRWPVRQVSRWPAIVGTDRMFGDEARITWDDGWHDVIRKAGGHWEKAAYAPGKSFSDPPDNITGATRTEPI